MPQLLYVHELLTAILINLVIVSPGDSGGEILHITNVPHGGRLVEGLRDDMNGGIERR